MYQHNVWGNLITIQTTSKVFSPGGADAGTQAMMACVQLQPGQRLLDLGCGAGVVGIAAAKVLGAQNVWMTDCDAAAVELARSNASENNVDGVTIVCGDAYDALEVTGFDWILSNPPYHADFSVAKRFIEKGFNRLAVGGKMVMVVKRALWYRNKLTSIFGGVREQEVLGYYVFTAQKRAESYAPKKQKVPKTPPKSDKKRRK